MLTNAQILAVYGTAEKAIRRTCARYNAQVSEDALADLQQGTLEKLLKSFDASKGSPDQLAWRIAANVATDYLRGRTTAAIKNNDQSLSVEDDEGTETTLDVADDSGNAFELLAARQLDTAITCALADLTDGQKSGVRGFFASDEESMTGSERIAKMRAVEALSESIKSSHFTMAKPGKKVAKKKAPKRAPKVEAEETEVPGLRRLSTVVRIEMELMHLLRSPLVVLGPA